MPLGKLGGILFVKTERKARLSQADLGTATSMICREGVIVLDFWLVLMAGCYFLLSLYFLLFMPYGFFISQRSEG